MNFKQIYAIKKANEEKILKVCPDCPRTSGIYFLIREDNGFKYCYIGQARCLLERLGSHLSGYQQHIDRSLKKHGLWSEENPTGWQVFTLKFPVEVLDEREQYFIQKYANSGYQMLNVTGGSQGKGKFNIGENKQSRGYYEGLNNGYERARKEIAHLFNLHLDYTTKKQPPTKLQEKAMAKFKDFLEYERNEE